VQVYLCEVGLTSTSPITAADILKTECTEAVTSRERAPVLVAVKVMQANADEQTRYFTHIYLSFHN